MSEQKAIKSDIDKYSSLESLANSKGGKILMNSLKKDVIASIDELCAIYKTAPDVELRAVIARMSERLLMFRTLNKAEKNKRYAKATLQRLIEEDGAEEEDTL